VLHNIRAAEEVAIQLWKFGYAVICPHANTRLFDGIFDEGKMASDNSMNFINGDLEMLNRFNPRRDVVVMMPKYHLSEGAGLEHDHAAKLGIPIYYWEHITEQEALEMLIADDKNDALGKLSWPEDA
jgi:hypothetical protein